MKVTTQLLHDLKACPEQVKLFSRLYPDGVSYDTQAELQRALDKASRQKLDTLWFIIRMKLSCVYKEYYDTGQLLYKHRYKNGSRKGEGSVYVREASKGKK